jgi:hypothetical protein
MGDFNNQGDLAETSFIVEAYKRGWQISIPFSNSSSYDLILDSGEFLYKIQIKSCGYLRKRVTINDKHYRVNISNLNGKYDFLAVYIIPEELWYIIPVDIIDSKYLSLYPHVENSRSKYNHYKEAWDLII